MTAPFDPLAAIKRVLILHQLRQMVDADLRMLGQGLPLQLARGYAVWLERLHAHLLRNISALKRDLRRHGVRIVKQQKNSLDFHIAYVRGGYEIQHCFLLATLQAEALDAFAHYLEGGLYEESGSN